MNVFSQKLTSEAKTRLRKHLEEGPYEHHDVAHAEIAAKGNHVHIVLYSSGKLVVQGKGTQEWLEFVFEPDILQHHSATPEAKTPSETSPFPRIGIDESGKGDFFGPMVIAGYLITEGSASLLAELGVRDSKRITSDQKIANIANQLLKQTPTHCEVLVLNPETYNRLVAKMGSVNRVLAWGHATVLETLLERHPTTQHAVADQFGPEHQITSALKPRGKAITLTQRHRAESDPAVAAASILARNGFVQALQELSTLAGVKLPPGATHVRPTAEELVRKAGPELLTRLAKTHFRTTRQVLADTGHDPALLGTPEPKSWKKR